MPVQNSHVLLPYAVPKEAVLENLQTTREKGLTQEEVSKRLLQFGKNAISEKKKVSMLEIFLRQFKNSLTITLLVAVVLILFVFWFGTRDQSDLIEAGLIFVIIILIAALGFAQEFKAEKALASLKKMLAFKADVFRDGKTQEIDVTELVPGDIIFLEEGVKVPADIRLLEVLNLHTNESALTGESLPVRKSETVLSEKDQVADQKNMVFAGTTVTSGRGTGVVVSTGDRTEIGKIAKLVAEEEDEETLIQKRLNAVGKKIAYFVLVVSIIVFIFINFFANDTASLSLMERLVTSFIAAVALAVAAIPEGLPAVVTISLAVGAQRLVKKNALVRKLTAIETVGTVDVICTDKTGTLTKNEMTVKEMFFDNNHVVVSGTGYETTGTFSIEGEEIDPQELVMLLQAGLSCNNATLTEKSIIGDPTEGALLVSARKAGLSDAFDRVLEIPFTSERKSMSVVVKDKNKYLLFMKGAPELVLGHCTSLLRKNKAHAITAKEKTMIHEKVNDMNSRAMRTLGFAFRELTHEEFTKMKEDPEKWEKGLTFLGLQAMIDPAREEVAPLIASCRESGIRVIMITGDHENTARAIAKQVGIQGEAITGERFDEMDEKERNNAIKTISIYARINPGTKMKIIDSLKHHGHVVAMTGDGVNDAPALKKADIGIAMGITGTDVAKESSDIVLLDDKFSTIIAAIEEGRTIFHNIQKFIHYLLTSNFAEVVVVFTVFMMYRDLPLTAVMLLWNNIVSDGLPAIALSIDRVSKNVMSIPAKHFQQDILTKKIWVDMISITVIITGAILGIFLFNHRPISENRGVAFLLITLIEIIYLFIIRRDYNTKFFSNRWLFISVYYMIILQVLIVYTPFLSRLFDATIPTAQDWLYIFGVLIGTIVFYMLIKRQSGIKQEETGL